MGDPAGAIERAIFITLLLMRPFRYLVAPVRLAAHPIFRCLAKTLQAASGSPQCASHG